MKPVVLLIGLYMNSVYNIFDDVDDKIHIRLVNNTDDHVYNFYDYGDNFDSYHCYQRVKYPIQESLGMAYYEPS